MAEYTVDLLKHVLAEVPGNYLIKVREPINGTFESKDLHLIAVTGDNEVLILSETFA
jgi:hypothetical protein